MGTKAKKMNIALITLYIWLTVTFIWYGRHAKSSAFDRPLLLSSSVFNLLFELIALVWIVVTIILLFKNWRLPVFTFFGISLLKIFIIRIAELIENIALTPILYLYKLFDDKAKKMLSDEKSDEGIIKTKVYYNIGEFKVKKGMDLSEVKAIIQEFDCISLSYFMSSLSIGYNDSKKLTEMLLKEGIVKKRDGTETLYNVIKD